MKITNRWLRSSFFYVISLQTSLIFPEILNSIIYIYIYLTDGDSNPEILVNQHISRQKSGLCYFLFALQTSRRCNHANTLLSCSICLSRFGETHVYQHEIKAASCHGQYVFSYLKKKKV